ncbi:MULTISPECIES: glucosaminidase domain-containing protein [Cysteiniphilum]|uniref:glucosaminidase domain-containing protein n=1 Tax=Cysteiniphilum TaxID=2056696 RepID=UPI00178400B8|nr:MULTISPECIES: glucosaminidase domain-containing protein [Cysteiniphilum]
MARINSIRSIKSKSIIFMVVLLSACTTANNMPDSSSYSGPKKTQKQQIYAQRNADSNKHDVLTKLNLPPSCSYDSAYKYLVLKGDAIDRIAHRIRVSSGCIVQMNNLEDNDLSISQALRLPKQAFINTMLTKMCPINRQILKDRDFLLALESKPTMTSQDKVRLRKLADVYALQAYEKDDSSLINHLLLRVNIIPESLTLAQAIVESNWGGSRFAVHGKNYFGLHCFSQGCGIAPKYPTPGVIDEVSEFTDVSAGIADYYRVLNTLAPYAEFREQRAQLIMLNGYDLADYLQSYSGLKGKEYATILKTVMRHNNLGQYDGLCEKI